MRVSQKQLFREINTTIFVVRVFATVGKPPPQQRFEIQMDPASTELVVTIDPACGKINQLSNQPRVDVLLFEVTPSAQTELGRFTFDGEVTAKDRHGNVFGPSFIRFEGKTEADVDWIPKQISLTQTGSGSFEKDEVVVWSPSGESIEIIEATSKAGFVKSRVIESELTQPGKYIVLRVAAIKSAPQQTDEIIIVRGRHVGGIEWMIPIPVTIQSNGPNEVVGSP